MMMYDGLTREELIKALEEMGQELTRLNARVKEDDRQMSALQKHADMLTDKLDKAARENRNSENIRLISVDVSEALARAWIDIIDHLRK